MTTRYRMLHLILCLFFIGAEVMAQTIGKWTLYPSFHNSTKNVVAADMVYTLCNGSLLTYSISDSEVRTWDVFDGLNGSQIIDIAYSEQAKKIFLLYEDFNIDLLSRNGKIVNMPDLRDKDMLKKNFLGLSVQGGCVYIGMEFGFVEVDLEKENFQRTCNLDMPVSSVAFVHGFAYAATRNGLYQCPAGSNLQDVTNWKKLSGSAFSQLQVQENTLTGLRSGGVFDIDSQGREQQLAQGTFSYLNQQGGVLTWGSTSKVYIRSKSTETPRSYTHPGTWVFASWHNGSLWVSEGYDGLCGYKLSEDTFNRFAGPIIPDSPIRNLSYRMQWVGDRLLVSGGINTMEAIYNLPTAMYYENGKWTNFQEMGKESVPEKYTYFRAANTTHLVQDPMDDTHHFASLHRNGICEYKVAKFRKFYHSENSPLQSCLPKNEQYYNYVSCSGLKYDTDGNLWMLCSLTDSVVRVIKPDGKWVSLYYPEIAVASLCDDYLIHSSGLIFLNSFWQNNLGFFCFDTNGTLENVRDDRHRLRAGIVNQDGTSYSPYKYYCMTEDLDGRIWCGTDFGLFVINDAEKFLDEDFTYEQIKIPRNDGSGLADYLLNGVAVSCIAVDGANRKWIGTLGNGIYLVSADGTEMIHHFMADNSPLPNDFIQCIAIHPTTGEVMIGTEKGLCSYVSDATEAADELDKDNILVYPNPVKADYTGPITVKGLTMDAEVKILSSTGQLIWSGVSAGGSFTWNGCNAKGKHVASGVYHVVANNAAGKKAIVSRIVVVR